ncbi:Knottin scorpion toxin-like superfamily [Arabidopsis suecica]|uniref:Knottin scorpion toxin-like superfamily n=2 Tax=Arabidopsis TaxID=3701 RepID=A0A8T1XSN3_ARASU|nr:Knottin scorpion toxin-like superfamily [Arabidopsis suecica]
MHSSIITVLFIFFLVISEMPEIKAQDSDCLKEYGGDVGFPFCGILIFPSVCYVKCRQDKKAKGGRCQVQQEEGDTKFTCLCDYCNSSPYLITL